MLRAAHADQLACQAAAAAARAAADEAALVHEAERRAHPRTPADFALLKADLAAWHDQAQPVSAVARGIFMICRSHVSVIDDPERECCAVLVYEWRKQTLQRILPGHGER